MLSELEDQALNVRHTNAVKLMMGGDLNGVAALSMIVCPSPELRDASMEAARQLPAKPAARQKAAPRSPVPVRRRRSSKMKASMTLDEILAAMS
jgi:hypothetical protein